MNRLLALAGLLFALTAQTLCAVTFTGATAGVWTYDTPAARQLADATDRPLLVMFANSSGECAWCNRFETQINSSEAWKIYATEQQLAMAFINYNGPNWNESYYVNVYSNNPAVTGFPAFVLYASDGTNILDAFSYNSTNVTFTADAFISRIDNALVDNAYKLDEEDIWDPADDTDVGATILPFQTFNQRQYHDLNMTPEDTDDWFKFLCVSGRRYKLQIPASDYQIDFAETVTSNLQQVVTNTFPAQPGTNAPSMSATTNRAEFVTNIISFAAYTNFYLEVSNALPVIVQLVTNQTVAAASTNLAPQTAPASKITVSTNLPSGRVQATTNGTPPELIAPVLTFLDPARQTPLNVDAGPLGTTNQLLISSLTNGCLFTPPATYNNAYCFINVRQVISNTPPSFSAVVYQPPLTNLTITTTVTNLTEQAVTRQTISNVWLTITYSGPTLVLTPNPPPDDYKYALIISSNLVTETSVLTVTNTVITPLTHTATNAVITEGSNYVTYAYARTQYTLNYRLWEPGEIVFCPAAVSVSESAASVRLTVTRTGGTAGAAKVSYNLADDTARAGEDYVAADGELFWADNQGGSTNITVELIQDLRPAWEGDERFSAALSKHPDTDWLQAAVGTTSNAVITIRESAAKNPGQLLFAGSGGDNTPFANTARPALTVTEGDALTLWVARAGGSNGTASVTVSTASSTAAAGAGFVALAETLTWSDGEFEPQAVTVQTLSREPYNRDATFTVRLSGATGAKLGAPASVTLTLRDDRAAFSLADTAAAAQAVGAAFKASGPVWFWSDEARTTLRCEPLSQGGRAVLQLTLTGPGRLAFDWEMADWAPPDELVCSGGVVSGKTLGAAAGASSVLVKAGRQTVTWTYTKATAPDAEAFAAVRNLLWQPLPKTAAPVPANGARVNPEALSWQSPAGSSIPLGGDFAAGPGGLALTRTAVALSPAGATLPNADDGVTFDALWNGAAPSFGTHYRWRVDTLFSDADGTITNPGDTWSFTAIDASEDTGLPPADTNAEGAYEALQGVVCDLGDISAEGLSFALIGGKLPPGLRLTAATGRISGVPTKAGSWTVTLQATAVEDGARVPRNSATFTITVYALGSFAGTYTGWTKTDRDDLPYSGSGSLTLSSVGDLSAQFIVNGTAYRFSKKGLDNTDDPAAPSVVGDVVCTGAILTTPGGTFTNTLDALSADTNGVLTATLSLHALVKNSDGSTTHTNTIHDVELFRNRWSEPALSALLGAFSGYYTVSLPVASTRDAATAPLGSGYVTMTVGAGGGVKLSGVLADGKTWSLSTTLLCPDPVEAGEAAEGKTADVYLYTRPAGYAGGFCGRLRIIAGASLYGNTVDCPDEGGALQWWNATPTCVYGATGATPSDTTGFRSGTAAAGGFYDKVMNLKTYYLNQTLAFRDSVPAAAPDTNTIDRIPSDYYGRGSSSGYALLTDAGLLPFDTALVIGAKSLAAPAKRIVYNDGESPASSPLTECIDFDASSNVAGLSLSLARATGLLTGSFALVYERQNADGAYARHTRKVFFKGVHTPARPREPGEDPAAGLQGAGFYLIPETSAYLDASGRTVTYSFNGSYAFELFAEE